MATFTLAINGDNAAFEEQPLAEVARILTALASVVGYNPSDLVCEGFLYDGNGNRVGSWRWAPEE